MFPSDLYNSCGDYFSCLLFYLVWFSVVRFILLLVVGQICCWLLVKFSFHFFIWFGSVWSRFFYSVVCCFIWFGPVWSRRSNKSQPSFGPFNHRPALPYLPQHYTWFHSHCYIVQTNCTSLFAVVPQLFRVKLYCYSVLFALQMTIGKAHLFAYLQ